MNTKIETKLKELEQESAQRGVEIEKLSKVINTFRSQLNRDFLNVVDEIIMSYKFRCTDKNGQKRLRNTIVSNGKQ